MRYYYDEVSYWDEEMMSFCGTYINIGHDITIQSTDLTSWNA